MSNISAQDVQKLRKAAGVGMMDAKRALQEAGGDLDKAMEELRVKGLAASAKRADREANEGTIGSYLHRQADRTVVGVLVELASETDFVAKSPEFQEAARDLAMHVAWANPRYVTKDEVPDEEIEEERRLIVRQAENEGKPDHVIPKIVEGRLDSLYRDVVLSEQKFVNGEKFDGTVGEMVQQLAAKMGENISVRRFVRYSIGQGQE